MKNTEYLMEKSISDLLEAAPQPRGPVRFTRFSGTQMRPNRARKSDPCGAFREWSASRPWRQHLRKSNV